jgi:hypothetical protein
MGGFLLRCGELFAISEFKSIANGELFSIRHKKTAVKRFGGGFGTILKVINAMGLQLHVSARINP